MIELAFILVNRLVNWGLGPIVATRTIAADGDAPHALLCGPANQWRLATSFAPVVNLQPGSDRCDARPRLPFGLRVPASEQINFSRRGRLLACEIRFGHARRPHRRHADPGRLEDNRTRSAGSSGRTDWTGWSVRNEPPSNALANPAERTYTCLLS